MTVIFQFFVFSNKILTFFLKCVNTFTGSLFSLHIFVRHKLNFWDFRKIIKEEWSQIIWIKNKIELQKIFECHDYHRHTIWNSWERIGTRILSILLKTTQIIFSDDFHIDGYINQNYRIWCSENPHVVLYSLVRLEEQRHHIPLQMRTAIHFTPR